MPQSTPPLRAVAVHERAGRLEPVRLAIRYGAGEDSASSALRETPLLAGGSRLGPFGLRLAVDAAGERARFEASVENLSATSTRLDAVIFGFRWRGVDTQALRFLRHGWQSWSFAGARALDDVGEAPFPSGPWLRGMHHASGSPEPDRDGWHESDLVTVAGVAPSGPACCAGVLERGRGFGIVYLRREPDAVRVELEVRVEARFEPGERREVERVELALGEDPVALLEGFADALGREAGARVRQPLPTGWCTWYHFFHRVREEDLRRNLDALAARRDELPIDVVQLDDGYQRAVGDWLETNEKFPGGLEKIAAEIRDAGFTPGLWTAPWLVAPESRLFEARPDWLLRDGGQPFRGLHHPIWARDGWIHVLDTSRDDVLAHLRELFARLVSMGFTYQKLDFLYAVAMAAEGSDPGVTRATRLRRGLEAVRAGVGEEAVLLGCGCPLGAAVGVVDAMRIGPDVAPRWHVDPEAVIPGIEPTLPATRNAVRNVMARTWMHRRLWINDPDCIMARSTATELSRDEARTLAAVSAASGGMVVFSDDVPALSSDEARLVRETVALAREVDVAAAAGFVRALDVLGDEFAAGVLGRTDSGALLALVNAHEGPRARRVDVARLGPSALRPVGGALLGTRARHPDPRSELRVELAPHASALWRLRSAALAVFCDYDGTFAQQDIGSTIAQRYARDRRPDEWTRFERGEISAWEYNLEILDGLYVPRAEAEAFLMSVELDPGARALVAWCDERGVPFRVLSDGFDYNLERLQQIHDIRFDYDSNRLRYEDDVWHIEAAFPNPACGCGTGTCKRGRIDTFRRENPGVRTVHIGNGRVSDLCGALAADVTFAKGSLAETLAERGHPFVRFETLDDVRPVLERMLDDSA